jgi:hypothetical protein
MVPVSVRRPASAASLDNQVSAVFVDLPVGRPTAGPARPIRGQMDEYKQTMQAVDARSRSSRWATSSRRRSLSLGSARGAADGQLVARP